MPKSRALKAPSRRCIVNAMLCLPATALVAPATSAASGDAALITAIKAAAALRDDIYARSMTERWDDDRIDAMCDLHQACLRRACEMPATTPDGLAAKMRVVLDQMSAGDAGVGEPHSMLHSLCLDLFRAAGA